MSLTFSFFIYSTLLFSSNHWPVNARRFIPRVPIALNSSDLPFPSTVNCTKRYIVQPVDHFSHGTTKTYRQRYYVYEKYWTKGGPIFFYVGNEADVGLYVNATGLIWENAEELHAYIVFAEHRYYGESIPFGKNPMNMSLSELGYLSQSQAIADYISLIADLRHTLGMDTAVIAFGGSYGGKLAAWIRMKYPASIAGAISASAPLLAFLAEEPTWNSDSYAAVITRTATSYSVDCASNVKNFVEIVSELAKTTQGRKALQQGLGLCDVPNTEVEALNLRLWIWDAFDTLAMGNYPWPSTYISGDPSHPMPAWPVRAACSFLNQPFEQHDKLLLAIRKASGVLYNVTGSVSCYSVPSYPTPFHPNEPMDGIWDFQWCTEMLPDSYWFGTNGETDMFWKKSFNMTLINEHCVAQWGIQPRIAHIAMEYGGRGLLQSHSNIVFSSGGYDPWSSGGVATNLTKSSLFSIMIPEGAHHLDMMFSHADDPRSVVEARKFELKLIKQWIEEAQLQTKAAAWGDKVEI